MDKSFRYKQLDQLLRYEDGYTLNDIILKLDDDISKRTLQRELKKLEAPPYNMKFVNNMYRGREKIIRYEDTSKSLYDTQDEMHEHFCSIISMLDKLSGIPQYDWMRYLLISLCNSMTFDVQSIISFDNNYDLTGLNYLGILIKAIVHKQPQRLVYRTFKGRKLEVKIHPYHLRQYRNRWFLLCLTDGKDCISNYALDRIVSLNDVAIPFKNTNINFDEWFDDVIGVTVPETPIEEIFIKIKKGRYGYIKTKPLHPSQIERKDLNNEEYKFITIKVKVNNELISTLASFGSDIEVISPVSVRNKLKSIAENLKNIYCHE